MKEKKPRGGVKKKKPLKGKKTPSSSPLVSSPPLSSFYSRGNDFPSPSDPSRSLTFRIFEKESELKEVFKFEFSDQISDAFKCPEADCDFAYVFEEKGALPRDPVVRMLVHHYLHLARDASDARVRLQALNRIAEFVDPPKELVRGGTFEGGVLSSKEKELLQLDGGEWEDA